MTSNDPLFSLLLHLEDGVESTLATLRSVADNTPAEVEYDTLILDDATSDATAALLDQLSGTVSVSRSDARVGQAAALAQLAATASSPLVVIIEQGAVLVPGWHRPLLDALRDQHVVAAQALVLDQEGVVASAGVDLAGDGRPVARWLGHRSPDELPAIETVDCLGGICLMLRTQALVDSGGLDPSYPVGAVRFAELSRRLAGSGHRLVVANRSRVIADHVVDLESGVMRFRRLALPSGPSARGPRVTSVALYLPAFHRIPENDRWWGDGFTEWNNVVKAQPLFAGHEQPRLPADLGIYDLRVPQTRAAQAELAERHGIGAFCYYHYWFHGRRLLEQPFAEVLESGEPALPFCLCWANEDWRANWDGSSGELLMPQTYSAEDDLEHIRWLCDAFRDRRYLRVEGKPIFLIYRAKQLPDVSATLARWREEAKRQGIGELFLCRVESFVDERDDPRPLGFDASVEFQPDWVELARVPGATGPARAIHDYHAVARQMLAKPAPEWRRIPCVTPSWDNAARRGSDATILAGSRPDLYRNWVETVSRREEHEHPESPLLFINAWNEWGEGAHLEPDSRWGTQYLEATRDATRAAAHPHTDDIALCVAGMYSSGSAAVAAWLRRCGLALESDQSESGSDESGGAIHGNFRMINERAIERRWPGSAGWLVPEDSACWFSVSEAAQARQLVQLKRRSNLQWGWEDPRSTLLLEAWLDVLPKLRTLLLWRPCQDVVTELLKAPPSDDRTLDASAATALWLAYNRRLVAFRRAYPEHCILIPAAAVTAFPRDVIELLRLRLDLTLDYREPGTGDSTSPNRPSSPGREAAGQEALIGTEVSAVERELHELSDVDPSAALTAAQ